MLLLTLIASICLNRLLFHPIGKIARYLEELETETLEREFRLRTGPPAERYSELDEITGAINKMRTRLLAQMEQVRTSDDDTTRRERILEQRVDRRTRELEEALAELRENEQRYAQAVRLAKLGHWEWDRVRDECHYCSVEMARMLGMTVEEYMTDFSNQRLLLEMIHPDDRDRYAREAVRREDYYEIEFRWVNQQGEVRHLREIGEPVRDEGGKIVRLRGSAQDLTEVKQAERELAEKKSVLEAILDNMDQGVFLVDGDLRLVTYNRRLCELLDLPAVFLDQRPTSEGILRYQIERDEFTDRSSIETQVEHWSAPLKARQGSYSYERERPDGSVIEARNILLADGRLGAHVHRHHRAGEGRQKAGGSDAGVGVRQPGQKRVCGQYES